MTMLNNLKTLLIPRKGSNKVDDLDTNWRAIERWAQKVGGFYASLTGPGETTTPGALTQEGGFTVTAGSEDINLSTQAMLNMFAQAGAGLGSGTGDTTVFSDLGNIFIEVLGTSGQGIVLGGTGEFNSTITLENASIRLGNSTSDRVGFFNNTTSQLTVTGSRGGNAALTNLLTALGAGGYGLIVDGTTP